LHIASALGHRKVVNFLLRVGADVNAVDDDGKTPLHVCAERSGSWRTVKDLIERGSNPYASDRNGNRPMYLAAKNGFILTVKYLVSKKNVLDLPNFNGQHALDVMHT
jgi:ankyrin repeat protein